MSKDFIDALAYAAASYAALNEPMANGPQENGPANNSMTNQTAQMLGHINGRRSQAQPFVPDESQLARDTRAVLENLQGHRDRGDTLLPTTQQFLDRATQAAVDPRAAAAEATQAVDRFAQENPAAFAQNVAQAWRQGALSDAQALGLLEALPSGPTLNMADAILQEIQLRDQQANMDELIRSQLLATPRSILIPVAEEPEPVVEPEPEPEAKSAFDALADRGQAPRRVLKKLKKPQR
jgi:hypothetical protein